MLFRCERGHIALKHSFGRVEHYLNLVSTRLDESHMPDVIHVLSVCLPSQLLLLMVAAFKRFKGVEVFSKIRC